MMTNHMPVMVVVPDMVPMMGMAAMAAGMMGRVAVMPVGMMGPVTMVVAGVMMAAMTVVPVMAMMAAVMPATMAAARLHRVGGDAPEQHPQHDQERGRSNAREHSLCLHFAGQADARYQG
jgi:hypothetical protein